MDSETKLVSVEKFPLKPLNVLRQHLRDGGYPVSDATAVRHAAIERANQITIAATLADALAQPAAALSKFGNGAPVEPVAGGTFAPGHCSTINCPNLATHFDPQRGSHYCNEHPHNAADPSGPPSETNDSDAAEGGGE